MAIRWSPLKVKEATDKVEDTIKPILEPLEQAKVVVIEAKKLPNLPDYMKERLSRLECEIERLTGGINSWDKKPYKGCIHRAIDTIRENLPKDDLAREQAQFQKWLDLFDGDKEKALVGMGISRPEPKEAPQMSLVAYNPVGEAIDFFKKGEIGGDEGEDDLRDEEGEDELLQQV